MSTESTQSEVSARRRSRVPVWLRWLLGVPCVLVLAFFAFVPPQRPPSMAGWTPGCDELPSEPWRELVLRGSEVSLPGDAKLRGALGQWLLVGDALWMAPQLLLHDAHAQGLVAEPAGTGAWRVLPDLELLRPVGVSNGQTVSWTTDERVWIPVTRFDGERVLGWELLGRDRTTGEEVARVPLPVERAWYPVLSFELYRLPVVAGHPWVFATRIRRSPPEGGKAATGFWLMEFDAMSETFGRTQFVPRPPNPEEATGGQRAGPFTLWTEEGPTLTVGRDPLIWHVDPFEPGPPLYRAQSGPEVDDPLDALAWPTVTSGPGWKSENWELETGQSAAVRLCVPSEQYGVSELVNTLWPNPNAQLQPGQQVTPQQRAQSDRRSRTISRAAHADEWLQSRYRDGTYRLGTPQLATSWSPTFAPLPVEFATSLRATVDYLEIAWVNEVPGINAYVVDEDTTLLLQPVLTASDDRTSHPTGVVRFGLLEPPLSAPRWIGYVPLPASARTYRSALCPVLAATDSGWLLGLWGFRPGELADEVMGMCWTRIEYPEGFTMPYRGWMSASVPAAWWPEAQRGERYVPTAAAQSPAE